MTLFKDLELRIVMNSTCIHLRTGGPNIYMYIKGKYTKNPLKKYNNRKANIHLTITKQEYTRTQSAIMSVKQESDLAGYMPFSAGSTILASASIS